MYDLIIANKNYSSWSLRPWVLLKTLAIPFNERLFPFGPAFESAAFLHASPTRRVPVLRDGDVTIWDSLAIVEYVAESHPAVWPADKTARAWARCAAAEMHSGFTTLRNQCAMSCGVRVALNDTPAALGRELARIGSLWREGLDTFGGPFLAGATFTAVDAFFAPVVFRLQTYGLSVGAEGDAYAARILALESMQTWYAEALDETTTEASHEADVLSVGTITHDFRVTAKQNA
ncbi:MAG: glutathione S-transferase family protein [Achromobacter sp.]